MAFKRLLLWLCLCVLASAEEAAAPWLLHPLEPPSRLAISDLLLHLDYRQRLHPGFVSLHCQADLRNTASIATDEQLMLVCSDQASQVRWNGKEVAQDRLVMPMPGASNGEMTRVSVFHLILLAGERGHLQFDAQQRLDFLSHSRHRVRLILPVHRSWQQVGDIALKIDLAPELRLIQGERYTIKNGTAERRVSGYVKSTEIQVEADWSGPNTLLAVPALRRAWLWGGLAALVGVSLAALGRGGWLLSVPVAMLLNYELRSLDPVLQQWTYYEGSRGLAVALNLQYYLVPVWALCGTLGALVLGVRRKEEK